MGTRLSLSRLPTSGLTPGRAQSRVRSVASTVALAVCAMLVVGLVFVAAAPTLLGWHFVIVGGGSMEPAVPYGSLAVVEDVSPGDIHVGEIVTFAHPAYRDKIVTHRVVSISPDGQVTTKGDANGLPDDGTIDVSHIQHRFLFAIPELGSVVRWLGSRTGVFAMVLVPGALAILVEAHSIWRAIQQHRNEPSPEDEAPPAGTRSGAVTIERRAPRSEAVVRERPIFDWPIQEMVSRVRPEAMPVGDPMRPVMSRSGGRMKPNHAGTLRSGRGGVAQSGAGTPADRIAA